MLNVGNVNAVNANQNVNFKGQVKSNVFREIKRLKKQELQYTCKLNPNNENLPKILDEVANKWDKLKDSIVEYMKNTDKHTKLSIYRGEFNKGFKLSNKKLG